MATVAPSKKSQSQQPPDERFWVKYSPKHEMPLSSASSIALHVLAVGVLALIFLYAKNLDHHNDPIDVSSIELEGGGGGSPDGQGNDNGKNSKVEMPTGDNSKATGEKPPDKPTEALATPILDPTDVAFDDNGREIDIDPAVLAGLKKLPEDFRKNAFNGVKAEGQGGKGTGGGKGNGVGNGEGDGAGSGKGKMNIRQKRMLRWTMTFVTNGGDDYRMQLQALGAIIAVPSDNGQYLVFRNLERGRASGKVEDLKDLNRIFWVDDRAKSVEDLCNSLGIRPTPASIVAFFPPELEDKLLKLEKNFHRKPEDQIIETRFTVDRRGGTFEPRVEGGR